MNVCVCEGGKGFRVTRYIVFDEIYFSVNATTYVHVGIDEFENLKYIYLSNIY